jgi:hypothetical protein
LAKSEAEIQARIQELERQIREIHWEPANRRTPGLSVEAGPIELDPDWFDTELMQIFETGD